MPLVPPCTRNVSPFASRARSKTLFQTVKYVSGRLAACSSDRARGPRCVASSLESPCRALYSRRVKDSSSERNLAALLARAARKWPRLPAIALGSRALQTYASLAERCGLLAAALANTGLRPGDC